MSTTSTQTNPQTTTTASAIECPPLLIVDALCSLTSFLGEVGGVTSIPDSTIFPTAPFAPQPPSTNSNTNIKSSTSSSTADHNRTLSILGPADPSLPAETSRTASEAGSNKSTTTQEMSPSTRNPDGKSGESVPTAVFPLSQSEMSPNISTGPTASPVESNITVKSASKGFWDDKKAIGGVFGAVGLVILAAVLAWILWKRHYSRKSAVNEAGKKGSATVLSYKFDEKFQGWDQIESDKFSTTEAESSKHILR